MNLEILWLVTVFAFASLFYGYYSRTDSWRIVGIVFLFFTGIAFEPFIPSPFGEIQYKSGINITTVGSSTISTDLYESYTNHTLGFFYVIASVWGAIIVWGERRQFQDE